MRAAAMCAFVTAAAAAVTDAPTASPTDDDDDANDAYSVSAEWCDERRHYVSRINDLAFAQSAIGAVGLLASGAALLVIVGSRQDRTLAGRVLAGVLVSNAIFAIADVVPTDAQRTSGTECTWSLVGPRHNETVAQCLPAALRFLGVYLSL